MMPLREGGYMDPPIHFPLLVMRRELKPMGEMHRLNTYFPQIWTNLADLLGGMTVIAD
jgi:hypothetical protein